MNLELKQRFFWEVLMGSFVNQLRLKWVGHAIRCVLTLPYGRLMV